VYAVQGLAKANAALGLSPSHNSLFEAATPSDCFDELLGQGLKKYQDKDFKVALATALEIEKTIERNSERYANPEFRSAALNLQGICHLAMNELDAARSAYEKSLQANPASSEACAGLGEVFYLAGHDRESKLMFEWAVKNDPANASAHAGLSKVNMELGIDVTDNTLLKTTPEHGQMQETR
jgi:tetratricopeptide (TPR) repeat protein